MHACVCVPKAVLFLFCYLFPIQKWVFNLSLRFSTFPQPNPVPTKMERTTYDVCTSSAFPTHTHTYTDRLLVTPTRKHVYIFTPAYMCIPSCGPYAYNERDVLKSRHLFLFVFYFLSVLPLRVCECVCLLVCGFFVVSFFLLVLHAWQTYECTFSILCLVFLLFFFSAFHLIVCHLSLPSSSSVNSSDCCFCYYCVVVVVLYKIFNVHVYHC